MISQNSRTGGANSFLADRHREYLHNCAVNDKFIDGRPYLTLTDELRRELTSEFNFHQAQLDTEGLVITRYDVATGEATHPQVRYDTPRPDANGELQKYTSPKGSGGVVDAHPLVRERILNTLDDLWLAESIKGADALLSNGALAIGVFGVHGYSKDRMISPGLDHIPLRGRVVSVAFDADVRDPEKRGPMKGLAQICNYLVWALGARVNVAEIPFASDGTKLGIDDVLPKVR